MRSSLQTGRTHAPVLICRNATFSLSYCQHWLLFFSIFTCFHLCPPSFSSICFPSISCAEPQVTASFHNLTISSEIRGGIKSQGKLSPFCHCHIQNVLFNVLRANPPREPQNSLMPWHVFMLWRLLLQFHADVHVDLEVYLNVLMFSPLISYLQQFCRFNAATKSNVSFLSPELRSSISWSSCKTGRLPTIILFHE